MWLFMAAGLHGANDDGDVSQAGVFFDGQRHGVVDGLVNISGFKFELFKPELGAVMHGGFLVFGVAERKGVKCDQRAERDEEC